jgi:O-antigen/teichoic acid export membrane protein
MLRVGMYNLAGALVRLAFAAVSIPILLRALGPDLYGVWSWVLAVLGFAALAEVGLSTATTILVARAAAGSEPRALAEILTVVVVTVTVLAGAVGGALWLAAGWMVAQGDAAAAHQTDAVRALRIGAVYAWTRCLQQVLAAILQAFRRYGMSNALVSAQAVVSTLGLMALARRGAGVDVLALWLTACGCLFLVLHALACRGAVRGRGLRPRWSSARLRTLLGQGAGGWLVALGGVLFTQGDRLVVGAVLGSASLGVYAAFTSIAFQINALSAVAVQPLLPELAARPERDTPSFEGRIAQSVRLNFALALGMGLGLVLLAPFVVRLVLGTAATAEQAAALRALGAIYGVYSVTAVGYYVLQGTGRLYTCAAIVLASGAATLTLIAIGGRIGGLRGAVLGNAGYALTLALHLTAMSRLGIGWRRWLGWTALPLFVFAGAILLERALPATLAVRLGAAAFASALLALWTLRARTGSGLAEALRVAP